MPDLFGRFPPAPVHPPSPVAAARALGRDAAHPLPPEDRSRWLRTRGGSPGSDGPPLQKATP